MDKVSTVTSSVRWWSRCCLFLSLLLLAAIRPAQGLAIGGPYRPEDTSSGHQQQQDDEVDLENSETLRIRLVRSLGLTRMPDLSQGPIPKEVMDEAYETYRRNVRETERRHHQLMTQTQYQDGGHEDDTFVVTFHSQGANSPTDVVLPEWTSQSGNDSSTWFYFDVDLTNHSENVNDVEVVQASIQTSRGDKVWWWWSSSSSYHDRLDGQWELLSSADDADDEEEEEEEEYDKKSVHRKWDASEAVRTWVQSPTNINRGLVIVQRDFDSSHVTTADDNLRLEVTLSRRTDSVRRSKRSTPHDLLKEPAWTGKTDCRKGTRHNYCCRKSLTVTAEQLGLGDIIIEPKKFNFYHCRGKCPHKYNPASTHAILQSLIYRTYKKGGKVCCAPSKLGDLEVLHLDEAGKNPVHSQWKNAVVLECACS